MSDFWSPLYLLIDSRRRDLGLGMGALATRCGCNPAKGARWINTIAHGEVSHARAQEILRCLPSALGVHQTEVDEALAQTIRLNDQRRLAEEARREAKWRALFKPHAYFDTESRMPTQITMFLITGGPDKYLKIKLDPSQRPLTYASQAAKVVQETDRIRFFGKPVGFFVNYSPDCAIRFDLEGEPVEALDRAYEPGSGSISMGGRRISGDELTRLVGAWHGHTVVIADIHGMAGMLRRSLREIDEWLDARNARRNAQFIFLGDYIDAGPDSKDVIDHVRTRQIAGAIYLRGNHEQLMIDSTKSHLGEQNFLFNGGASTRASLGASFGDVQSWMKALTTFYKDDPRYYVHAGIKPKDSLYQQDDYFRL